MKHRARILIPLLLCLPLLAPAARRLDVKPLPATRMEGRIAFPSLTRTTAKQELGAEKSESARLEVGPKLRPLNARRGTVEQRTQNIRLLQKKKKTIDINND